MYKTSIFFCCLSKEPGQPTTAIYTFFIYFCSWIIVEEEDNEATPIPRLRTAGARIGAKCERVGSTMVERDNNQSPRFYVVMYVERIFVQETDDKIGEVNFSEL